MKGREPVVDDHRRILPEDERRPDGKAPTVRSLWVGPPLSEMEWVCLSSFVRHGARFELFTDDLSRPVPPGVSLRDCRELLGKGLPRYGPRAREGQGSYAIAADLARLRSLFAQGEWWVDTDTFCLRPFQPIDGGYRFGREDEEGTVNVAVIRLPPGSELARLLLRRVRFPWLGSPWETWRKRLRNLRELRDTILHPFDVPWGWSGGPRALTAAVRHLGLEGAVLPPAAFYPVPWPEWSSIPSMTAESFEALSREAYAVHLWGEMYRRHGVDRGEAIRGAPWARPYLEGFPRSGRGA